MKFTKEQSLMVKGMAILFMLCRHLLILNRQPVENQLHSDIYGWQTPYFVMGLSTQICVAMFMFLGGIGLYYTIQNGRNILKNIGSLYIKLWRVFIIYIPIGFLLYHDFDKIWCEEISTCTVFSEFILKQFLFNFFGLATDYNREWWFFKTYICSILVGFLFIKVTKKINNLWIHVSIIFIFYYLTHIFFPRLVESEELAYIRYNFFYFNFLTIQVTASCLLLGITFAKFGLFDRMIELWENMVPNKKISMILGLIGILLILYVRYRFFGEEGDLLLVVPIVLFSLQFTKGINWIAYIFQSLGRHSSSMWLIHSFYCYYYYHTAMIVYDTQNPVIAYVILLIMTFLSSLILDYAYDGLHKIATSAIKKYQSDTIL